MAQSDVQQRTQMIQDQEQDQENVVSSSEGPERRLSSPRAKLDKA
jgi:hypothetical protein